MDALMHPRVHKLPFFIFLYRLNCAIKVQKIYNAFESDQFSEQTDYKRKEGNQKQILLIFRAFLAKK